MPPKVTKLYWLSIPHALFSDPRICELRAEFKGDGGLLAFQFLAYAGDCDAGGKLLSGDRPATPAVFALKFGYTQEFCENVFPKLVHVGWATIENGTYRVEPKLWAEVCKYDNNLKNGRIRTKNSRENKALETDSESQTSDEISAEQKISVSIENRSIKTTKTKSFSQDAERLAELLATQIIDFIPDFRELQQDKRSKTLSRYADTFDKMLRLDSRDATDIEKVILFATGDRTPKTSSGFCWAKNILSAEKLREKFDKLKVEAGNSARTRQASSQLPNNINLLAFRSGL